MGSHFSGGHDNIDCSLDLVHIRSIGFFGAVIGGVALIENIGVDMEVNDFRNLYKPQ